MSIPQEHIKFECITSDIANNWYGTPVITDYININDINFWCNINLSDKFSHEYFGPFKGKVIYTFYFKNIMDRTLFILTWK